MKPKIVNLDKRRLLARRKRLEERIRRMIESHTADSRDVSGFALVIWSADGTSTADMASDAGVSPTMMIPDFVRARLIGEKVEEWAIDAMNRSNGF